MCPSWEIFQSMTRPDRPKQNTHSLLNSRYSCLTPKAQPQKKTPPRLCLGSADRGCISFISVFPVLSSLSICEGHPVGPPVFTPALLQSLCLSSHQPLSSPGVLSLCGPSSLLCSPAHCTCPNFAAHHISASSSSMCQPL